uniref:Uncharacterized protein n=1 Tax=Lotus japonicus TaxID=34305 RepID=I3T5Z2_LOTJA|nr:unknown [Lotus japonicus]
MTRLWNVIFPLWSIGYNITQKTGTNASKWRTKALHELTWRLALWIFYAGPSQQCSSCFLKFW